MPRTFRAGLLVIAIFGLTPKPPCSAAGAADDDLARQQRLEFMTVWFGEFELFAGDQADAPLARTDEPVLRWTNPVRNFFNDGAVFLWLDGKRPVAAVSLSIRGDGNLGRELTSLSPEPLQCRRGERIVWSPQSGGLLDQPLPDAPAAARTPELRLIQMRRQARRFTARLHFPNWDNGKTEELRLMPQPIYRYAAPEDGIVDGALFVLAQANDPELLLLLEAVRSAGDGKAIWRYSLARMTTASSLIDLDGKQVWSNQGYWRSPRSPQDPYVEAIEGKYPAADGSVPLEESRP